MGKRDDLERVVLPEDLGGTVDSTRTRQILDTAIDAARAGGRVLERYFRGDESLEIERKGEHDYVSEADRKSEEVILAEIRRVFPAHRVLAEESGHSEGRGAGESEYGWYVDPLDGTTNFLHGVPVFCISIACRRGDETVAGVVLDPVHDDLFAAAKGRGATRNGRPMRASDRDGLKGSFLATGYPWRARAAIEQYLGAFHDVFLQAKSVRRCGAAALDLAYTAAGVYDGFFEFRLSPWDVAAGILLVEEAGGIVTDLDGGRRWLEGGNVLAGGAKVHGALREAVARHADEALLDRLVPVDAEEPQPVAQGSPA